MTRPTRWLRLTVRQMMALVMGLALALRLAVPAIKVYQDRDQHIHAHVNLDSGSVQIHLGSIDLPPFRILHWWRFTGQTQAPWPTGGKGEGRLAETCSHDHSEYHVDGQNPFRINETPRIQAVVFRFFTEQSAKEGSNAIKESGR